MVNVPQSAALTTQATAIQRVKYFPIELYCANMIPNTTYDAYVNGQDVNAFCKPYGQKLGASLTSNQAGKLRFQYFMSVTYNQPFLVNPTQTTPNLISTAQTINLVDPFNRSSVFPLPLLLKSGTSSS